jgi:hypothetical protein
MIRLTTALLTLGVIIAIASTVSAQAQGECFWVGCNPEADLCRLFCGSDDPRQTEIGRQWQAPYASAHPRYQYHRHVKHHHKTAHYSG